MDILQPEKILETSTLEVRGDGKAGGGLVLAMQSFAGLFVHNEKLHVQEWPFFSSARKGAAIRSFLRVSRKPITISCEVTEPHMSVLMDDGAAKFVDFAEGVPKGGIFIVNTHHTPEEAARHYKLSGRVMTIAGDQLGQKHLKRPIGNISVFAALVRSVPALDPKTAKEALLHTLKKRRIPQAIQDANATLFDASMDACQVGVYDYCGPKDHQPKPFQGYGDIPMGAQTPLRISRSNKTASYARSGARIEFADPEQKCTGCTFCISDCPENIINFVPDPKRGVRVTGADFSTYCKFCRECIEACPQNLFAEREFEEVWEDVKR